MENIKLAIKRLYRVLKTKTSHVCATEFSKNHFLPRCPLPGHRFDYNIVVNEEIQRWRAVKHSLWVPCKVILYYTLNSIAAYIVGNCRRMNYRTIHFSTTWLHASAPWLGGNSKK